LQRFGCLVNENKEIVKSTANPYQNFPENPHIQMQLSNKSYQENANLHKNPRFS
jgi:hypothetical protein